MIIYFFFFNDTATTEIYTLSLHDALPISQVADALVDRLAPRGVIVVVEAEHLCMTMRGVRKPGARTVTSAVRGALKEDRKSTRLNSSHANISYAVFCLKKKKKNNNYKFIP